MLKRKGIKINKSIVLSLILLMVFFYNLINNRKVGEVIIKEADEDAVHDTPFMPRMLNETLKAELGNSAWKLLHTILSRYPEEPTTKEKQYLQMYIESFAQVYPCGDCARHFIKLLEQYPPQLNSRKNAALWGCSIHNRVNARLGKAHYDCAHVLEAYDCGCGEDERGDEEGEGDGGDGDGAADVSEQRAHLQSIRVESSEQRVGG